MNWLNIHTDDLRDPAFLEAENAERGAWISLLGWCVSQENSGVIEGCKGWSERRWQQLCGVSKEELNKGGGLFAFEGDDLVVSFYPVAQQATVIAQRKGGHKGGRPKKPDARKPLKNKGEKPHGSEEVNHEQNVKKRKEKKSKVKKDKIRESNSEEKTPSAIAWSCGDGWQELGDEQVAQWSGAYPKVDVSQQLDAMNQWLIANPSKANKSNWKRFIVNWLNRNQGEAEGAKNTTQPKSFAEINEEAKKEIYRSNMKNMLW
jgi:hypothetical protein